MRFENYIKTKSLFVKRKGFFVAVNNGANFGAACVWQSVTKFAKIGKFGYGHFL